jgi:hypothetical protein
LPVILGATPARGLFEVGSMRGQDGRRFWPRAVRACKVWLPHETCARYLRK